MPFIGEPIPGYRLIERLGRGGYGEVWKAEAPGGMHKAIKFVYGDLDGANSDGQGAEQEFKSLNRVKTIRHPFILSLERIEIIDGRLVIVMELADRNLWDRFAECVDSGLPGIPRAELLRYMEEAAEGLDLMNLHHQIQHLDIKPQNIFLVHRHVKIADFGLAKDLEGNQGELTGGITPMYAAPETFEQWVSRQSDQYSLAIVYMEMLTGRRPFNGTAPRHLILQHMTAAPDLGTMTSPDREAVAKALSKKPEDRFRTCMDFVRALKGELTVTLTRCPETASAPQAATGDATAMEAAVTERPHGLRSKSLPALVTPGAKVWSPAAGGSTRKPGPSTVPINRNDKPVERTGTGVLFPTLVIGLGGTGLAILRKLVQLVTDRSGRPRLPHMRFLYIDTDPTAIQSAQRSTRGPTFSAEEVLFTQLHRAAHYISREGLPPVDRWLSPEELYRIPRTPATEGVRAIGRLALCDHYQAVCQRVRSALETFLTPSALETADRLTGLGIRSSFPRVYVVCSLTGGTGSGMFLDLTYLIRREVRQLGFGTPHVVGLFGIPGMSYGQTNRKALANTRAAFIELQHLGSARAPYVGNFDTREKPFEDTERPFRRCAIVPVADQNELALAVSTLGHIAFADMLSPLGRVAHPDGTPNEKPYSVVGIQRIVWPRAQILRAAAWLLSRRTLTQWMSKDAGPATAALPDYIAMQWSERKLDRVTFRSAIEEGLVKTLGPSPAERIARALAPLTKNSDPEVPHTERLLAAFGQLLELVGKPGAADRDSPCQVGTALAARVRDLVTQANAKLSAMILALVEQPGLRVAGAEEAVRILRARLNDELRIADYEAMIIEEQAMTLFMPIHSRLVAACEDKLDSGTNWTSAAAAADVLCRWATVRWQGLLARSCANVYRAMLDNIPEQVRELNFIREQLGSFVKDLDEAVPSGSPDDGVCTPIFPNGAVNATDSVKRILQTVGPDDWREFENALQARVRHECRGVVEVCNRPKELLAGFLTLICDLAASFLDPRAPTLKAVEVLAQNATDGNDLESRVSSLLAEAAPEGMSKGRTTMTVVGVPDKGEEIADLVSTICPNDLVRIAQSSDDIVVWRESGGVALKSFTHLSADTAYLPPVDGRATSAHSRHDISWPGDL